ncbi:MAG: efflux RND transporter periplasmic adaptor subunit [Betaproteobacteria bacterium]|nr:efflux RND transporter periplasmic adaptor subunit [Betaproteobacteria bacterium]
MVQKKKYVLAAVLGIGLASAAAWWYQHKSASPAPAPGAAATSPAAGQRGVPAVEVSKVATVTLVDQAQSVGSLRSRQGVMLRPEVSGRIKAILFVEGQAVSKGQLLVQFDDQLQLAQVAQARAEMSIAQANHKRNQDLVAQNFISQRSVDESAAALEVAKAKHELAQASLQRLKIIAPFDGVIGLKQVNVGDYLKDGADIVNIEDTDALLVDFRLPERLQGKIKPGQKAQLSIDALPGRPVTAQVQAVDPLIDVNGRSVAVRGCIDNRQRQLRPGMFARVNTVFGVHDQALVVPEEAIVPQGGRSFVVKVVPGEQPDTLVSQRVVVKTGVRQPGRVEILEGLSSEDTVVTAGHQRLQKDGSPVRVIDLSAAGKGPQAGASAPQAGASAPQAAGAGGGAAAGAGGAGGAGGARAAAPNPRPAPGQRVAPAGPHPCQRG